MGGVYLENVYAGVQFSASLYRSSLRMAALKACGRRSRYLGWFYRLGISSTVTDTENQHDEVI